VAAEPTDKPDTGVRCPKCNCAVSKVYYTRGRGGATRRVRICGYCGCRYTTKETVTGS